MTDHDQLGVDYRDAKQAIGDHRRLQAEAEVELGRLLQANRGRHDTPEITAARAAVDKAVADVAWCQALVIACGELFKGTPFEEVEES
jgi:hypothetical protein